MTGSEKNRRGELPVHKSLLPDISQCRTTRQKIDAFLDRLDDKRLEHAYKIIKRIFFYGS